MKRMVSLLCAAALFCLVFYGTAASAVTGSNLLPADASEMHPSKAYWFPFGGELEYRQVEGNSILVYPTLPGKSWCSPAVEIFNLIQASGAGEYRIEFDIMVSTSQASTGLNTLFRCTNQTSLCTSANDDKSEFRGSLGRIDEISNNTWRHFSSTFGVSREDIVGSNSWILCFDAIGEDISYIYLDNVSLVKQSENYASPAPTPIPPQQNSDPLMAVTDAKISADNGTNLIEKASADFDTISDASGCRWFPFQGDALTVEKTGYQGNCITMYNVRYSWCSPALNIYPYITQSGQYIVAMLIRVEFNGTASSPSLTLRGDSQNSFIQNHNTQFFTGIGGTQEKIVSGEWTAVSGTFTVTQGDLAGAHHWALCLGNLPEDTVSVSIDGVSLVKDGNVQPPAGGEQQNNQNGQNELNSSMETGSKVIFNPLTWAAAIGTAGATLSLVLVAIAFKIKRNRAAQSSESSS